MTLTFRIARARAARDEWCRYQGNRITEELRNAVEAIEELAARLETAQAAFVRIIEIEAIVKRHPDSEGWAIARTGKAVTDLSPSFKTD